jgi:hypothetical protein
MAYDYPAAGDLVKFRQSLSDSGGGFPLSRAGQYVLIVRVLVRRDFNVVALKVLCEDGTYTAWGASAFCLVQRHRDVSHGDARGG